MAGLPNLPETKYATSDHVNIAYQVVGDGALDLVFVMGWVSNVDLLWQEPSYARFVERLAAFARVIIFDKRGTGLSDRVDNSELPTIEQRMDDVRAVMDAAGSPRAAVFGVSEGGPMAAVFAATYPERTTALILYGTYARRLKTADYPWAPTPEERQRFFDAIREGWGGVVDLATLAPSMANDARFRTWWATFLRQSASPGAALALAEMNSQVDIRHILPSIHVPTLILHRTGDLDMEVGGARWMALQVPNARYIELPGNDHLPFVGDADAILDHIEEFLTGARHAPEPDRILATVMFADIVGSTRRAAQMGDSAWRRLLVDFYTLVRKELVRFRGKEIDSAGDGILASFDGPARGIRCAGAIAQAVKELGIEIRAGLHTGECERIGEKMGGIAVHIGARVMAHAGPGEVWVSSTVKDLVAGSGMQFEDRGTHTLEGVPGEWKLFQVLGPF